MKLNNRLWLLGLVPLGMAFFGLFVVPAAADWSTRQLTVQPNDLPSWMVRVSVDREDRTYRVGDRVTIKVKSEKGGYLYVFNVDPDDNVLCLYPNKFQSDNKIAAKSEITIPDPDDTTFKITIGEPVGKELLKAIVTKKPLADLDRRARSVKAGVPIQLSKKDFSKMVAEAMHLKEDGGGASLQEVKEETRKKYFKQFQVQAKEWAEHSIDLITLKKGGQVQGQRRVGLFVGISKYQSNAIRELKCSHLDAIKMAEVMKQRCDLDQAILVTDRQATRSNIEKKFHEELVEKTKPGDFVMIYWSGHGGRCANTDKTDKNESDEHDAYLVPTDGSLETAVEERRTMLLDKTFGRWVQALDGRKVIVILDTCHSGGQIEGMKSPNDDNDRLKFARGVDRLKGKHRAKWTKKHFLETEMARSKAIGQRSAAVLASATFKQLAFERREGDLGVLTYYLVERLQQGKGPLTLKQLADYARPRVKKYVEDEFIGATQDIVFSDQQVSPVAQVRK